MCCRGSYQNFLQRVKEQHKDSEWWVEITFFCPDHVFVGKLSKWLWFLHTPLLKRVYSQTHIAIVKPVLSGPVLGTIHFLSVWRGWWYLRRGGGNEKMALKGGGVQKNSNFAVTAFVIMQIANQNAKNQRFWHSKKFRLSQGSMPSDPLLYVYVFSYQSPSFLYCSFFDPDPESSCFGVSHYGGNVSEKAIDSTSFPGFSFPTSSWEPWGLVRHWLNFVPRILVPHQKVRTLGTKFATGSSFLRGSAIKKALFIIHILMHVFFFF